MFRSIKNKLIFLLLIAVLTPLLVMRLIAYPTAQKAFQETTLNNLQLAGSKRVFQINDWLKKLKDDAGHIAHNTFVAAATSMINADKNTNAQYVARIPYTENFQGFIIGDLSGIIRISTDDSLIGQDLTEYEGFRRAIKGVVSVTEEPFLAMHISYDLVHPIMGSSVYIASPVRTTRGTISGVIMLKIDLSSLTHEYREIPYSDRYDTYIVNRQGIMVHHFNHEKQLIAAKNLKEQMEQKLIVVEPHTSKFTKSVDSSLKGINGSDIDGYINHEGEKVLGAWFWIPELEWGVITEISVNRVSLAMNDLKNPIAKILSYLTVSGVILALTGIVFAFFIGEKIANPIVGLITATRKMSAGDLSQRVVIKTHDELQELVDAFNVMAESVQEKTSKLQETTNFLNNILISSTEHSIIASDLQGTILAFNEGAKRMFGYEPEELINKSGIEIVYTKSDVASGKVQEILETTLLNGRYKHEVQLVRKNGEVFTGYSTFTTRQSSDEKPIGFVMIVRDITEQKQLEQILHNYTVQLEKILEERTQKLRISEEKYRRLFESSKDVVFFCDIECQFVDINQAAVDLFGYESKSEILKLNLIQHLFFSISEGKATRGIVYKNGFIKDYEVELKKKDGSKIFCLMTSNLRRDERNSVIGYEGIIIDQTERKRIEQEKDIMNNINKILASKLDFREVFKSLSAELNKVVDFDRMSIALLNEKREEFLTYAVSKDYGISRLEEGVQYSKHGTLAGKVVENGKVYMVNDTSRGPFLTDPILYHEGIKSRSAFPLLSKGEIIGSVNFGSRKAHNFSENQFDFINKITPQLAIAIDNTRLFDKIKESEEKYRNLVEDIEDVIFRLDKTGRYLFLNSALKNVTGYRPQEFYDNPSIVKEIINKNDMPLVKETMQKVLNGNLKVSKDLEYRIFCKNGEELWVSQNTYPIKDKKAKIIGLEGIIRDITDRKRIEEQIRRSERLASIGELAASIAHEIRNPLGAISNSVCMLKRDLALNGDDQKLFDMVVEETDRLNSIITSFLTFAHPAEYHFMKSNIIDIIDETLFLLEQDARFHDEIKIIRSYNGTIPKIYADRNWIRKVFWNLLINSVDAMPDGGKILIRVKRIRTPDHDEIEIIVADQGNGIPPENIRKIFEPFFTTKKSKGTGLGLSIVHRIVDNHGGTIDVKSAQGKGTVFTIRLPVKNKQVKTLSV